MHFKGGPNPEMAQNWLREIRKLMEVTAIPKEHQVAIAIVLLVVKANHWWCSIRQINNTETMTWVEFEQLSYGKVTLRNNENLLILRAT